MTDQTPPPDVGLLTQAADQLAALRAVLDSFRLAVLTLAPDDVVVIHTAPGANLAEAHQLAAVVGGALPPGVRMCVLHPDIKLKVWRAGQPPPTLTVPRLQTTDLRHARPADRP